ncbi:MAG: dephospho-CoA kinase [Stackebrandtia sp.]
MLKVGLTGGIGAGKSAVAARLRDLGAVLIDSDVLARDVVAAGTAGLAQIVAAFGDGVLEASGALDRAALARRVFGDDAARSTLEGIVHPLVRQRADELTAAAADDAIVVNDVPLLAEVGLAPTFDLVLVVEAPEDVRLERLTRRGLPPEQARARIAAQTSDEIRRAVADELIPNRRSLEQLNDHIDAVWHRRLVPFEENKRLRRIVERREDTAPVSDYNSGWHAAFERIAARLRRVLGDAAGRVDHIGSTAVPGLAAKDVIDIQVTVADMAVADANREALEAAGFPATGVTTDAPHPASPEAKDWEKRLHGGTDPEQWVHIHLRAAGSLGARYALLLRDWLRADDTARARYSELKWRLKRTVATTSEYADRKEPHVTAMLPHAEAWAASTGWQWPPP